MAVQYIGINRGQPYVSPGMTPGTSNVATGSGTTGKGIELAVDLSANPTRAEVLRALEILAQFILDTRATPFAQ